MKLSAKHPVRLRQGFTLIEMLVVIGIIAILASMAMPVYNTVLKKAYETQARAMMNGLTVAIGGYQTEYNHYPNPTNNTTAGNQKMDTKQDSGLVSCLMGPSASSSSSSSSSTNSNPNPRGIQFYNPPIAKGSINGYDAVSGNLYDPWGMPMYVLMDIAGQGYLTNPYYGSSSYPSETQQNLGTGCIVWDWGADKTDGTTGQSTDDLRSWH